MGRTNSEAKVELKKGPWTREEDQKLLDYIQDHGHGNWRSLPAKAGLERCGKSCRLRWTNYLRPDIKRGKFSTQEEKAIIRLHALLGNRWSAIATHLPKRTDNEIKNYWNTRLKKRLTRMGIDPATHRPKNNPGGLAQSRQAANLSHMAQWETARLEAEARLVRESRRLSNLHLLRKVTRPPPPPPKQSLALPCLDVLKVWQATGKPNCFFNTTGSLDSPTSTLNFSGNNVTTVPMINGAHGSPFMASDVVFVDKPGACRVENVANSYAQVTDKMENSLQLHSKDSNYATDDFDMAGPAGIATLINHESEGYNMANSLMGDYEEANSYWNDLLNLVTLPVESSTVF